MRSLISQLIICALFVIETHQLLPIWGVVTNCTIPNESEMGECELPADCPAFQDINDVNSIGNVSRLSFVSQLQCSGLADGKICCPRRGSYANPWISMTNITKRVRNKPVSVSQRVGIRVEVPCGEPDYEVQVNSGEIAKIDDFPWMAMLIYEKAMNPVTPGCGGALISRSFVITAAHCLTGPIVHKKGALKIVRVGEYDIHNDPDCVVDGQYADCTDGIIDVKPKRIIVHPDYKADSVSQHHDIGLIELDQPVEFTTFIRHICLPDKGSGKIATKFSVCGWGRTDFFSRGKGTNVPSPIKLKTSLPYFDHGKCSEIYQQQRLQLINGQICAGGRNARDTCSGDSGSPLMSFDTKKAAWILSGLVSMGPQNCGTVGKPGIYTNVNEYVPWIKSNAHL
ncbi:serine protease easter [Aedes aegypti]|uniref:CLIP domain-containing serine protease n=1 Tax=Aedes aegypti TaxID=7159 RepID=A0A903UZN5_AEDAE|nr:serine protease easter [Aedes aegypti]